MERHVTKLVAAILVLISAQLWAAEDIPFRLAQKHFVIVPVLVNGEGPYEFLLDTGSTKSVVDRKLAKDLGLKPLQETVIRTASGTERVPIARIHQIDVGSHSTQTVLVLCSKMNGLRSLDKKIRGILGFNFLSRFRYTLDYKEKTLRFEDTGAREGTRVPFDASGRSIVITTNGQRLLLDTGATSVFLFNDDGLDIETNARAMRRVTTNSGLCISRSGWLRRLDIGDASFDRVPVTLVPPSGLDKVDGLVPGALFDSIYFDHENDYVVLNPMDGK